MLVLARKQGEVIFVGAEIAIRVVKLKSGTVKIGIDAPMEMKVLRGELIDGSRSQDDVDFHFSDCD